MSFWMFTILFGIGIAIIYLGCICIPDNEKNKNVIGTMFSFVLILLGLSVMGYSVYKYFIFDYSKLIEKAIVKHDYERAHELLFDMSQNSKETAEESFWRPGEKFKSKYTIAYEKVLKSELTYLLNHGDKESSDRLISLIGSMPIEATPTIGITNNKDTQRMNEDYSIYAGKINGICDDVLNNAISTGNKYLAEKILSLYKPTLIRALEESHWFSTDSYKYTYTNEMQIAARKRFEAAIESGSFK